MGKTNRLLFLIAGLLAVPAILFAQFNNATTSPYSRYGIGDLEPYSFGRSQAMGGATLASRYNLQINTANPASYTATDSLNFLFEFGLQGNYSKYRSNVSSMNSTDVNFNYFAMGFRLTDWMAASLGLLPYSNVGNYAKVNAETGVGDSYTIIYSGDGTISDAYLGLAVQPLKYLSVGFNLNYRFGNLEYSSALSFAQNNFYVVERKSMLRLRDFGLEFGIQGMLPLKNDQQITIGLVAENKPSYTGYKSDIIQKRISYPISQSQSATDLDTLYHVPEGKGQIIFPTTLGAGFSYAKKNVFEINFDYYYQNWSKATFFGEKNNFLTDLNKFAIGAEWIPDKFSIRSGLKRMAYRAGLRYEQTYYSFDGHKINDFGISFGLGIPLYRSNSTINIAAEFGKRGTTEYNLVEQKYAKFSLSASLHDLWFMQRRID